MNGRRWYLIVVGIVVTTLWAQQILAMFNGEDPVAKASAKPSIPLSLCCSSCNKPLVKALQAACGHRYHPDCGQQMVGQQCVGKDEGDVCQEILKAGEFYSDKAAEIGVMRLLHTGTVPGNGQGVGSCRKTAQPPKEICIYCNEQCDAQAVTYIQGGNAPAHAACAFKSTPPPMPPQMPDKHSYQSSDNGIEGLADSYKRLALDSSQLKAPGTSAIAIATGSSPISKERNTSHDLSGKNHRKRHLRNYKIALESQYGSLDIKPFPPERFYPVAKIMNEKGITYFQRFFNERISVPGCDLSEFRDRKSLLQEVERAIVSLAQGSYLLLLAFSDGKTRGSEPASLVAVSRGLSRGGWSLGDSDTGNVEAAAKEYCLLVVSPENTGDREWLRYLSKDETRNIAFAALFYLFGFGGEHAVLVTPESGKGQTVNIIDLLGGHHIASDRPIPVFFSIRNILKSLAMVLGMTFYTDMERNDVLVLTPLKRFLLQSKIADMGRLEHREILDQLILDMVGDKGDVYEPQHLDNQNIFQKLNSMQSGTGSIAKLQLNVTHVDQSLYYVFYENGRYYVYYHDEKEFPVLTCKRKDQVAEFFRFVLSVMKPTERIFTLFMDT